MGLTGTDHKMKVSINGVEGRTTLYLTALQKMLYSSRALLLIARKVANIVEFQFDG